MEEVSTALKSSGVEIDCERLALSRDQSKMFGVLDLIQPSQAVTNHMQGMTERECDPGRGLTLGLRSANDQSFSIQIVVGLRVFVCDNLCFSGDFMALSRKHTTGVNLRNEVRRGIDRYWEQSGHLREQFNQLEAAPLRIAHARDLIYDAFVKELLPTRYLKPVHSAYFSPEPTWEDCQPDTLYGLHNAFTRAIREEPTRPQLRHSAAIGRHFGLTSTN
tara:strand:- start:1468 stop:2124 length:657 start_codon:yes stop_codon:yes gene_type:complete